MAEPRRILFLDIDGVLNSAPFLMRQKPRPDGDWIEMLDPALCARLQRVLEATGAAIVLSSSWRVTCSAERMQDLLHRRGVTAARVIGVTPRSWNEHTPDAMLVAAAERGDEIRAWLRDHAGQWDAFAIVDDNGIGADLEHMLVRTTWAAGMQDEHVEELCALLGER